jgi:hypothetical protein
VHPESQSHVPADTRIGDATPSANRRLRHSLELVFQDVRLQTADAPPSQLTGLRESLRTVCAEARRSGLRAEQLLVLIKDVWMGLPAGISRVQSVHGDERLRYVISTCVDEYYGDSTARGSDASGRSIDAAADTVGEGEVTP